MSVLRAEVESLAVIAARPNAKLDQWICWWSIPFFYNLFGVIFVVFGKLMPPPKPGLTQAQVVDFLLSNRSSMQVAWVMLALSLGIFSLSSGLVVEHMKRMKGVSSVFAYSWLAVLAVAALPGCMFCGIMFGLAEFRLDRDPQLLMLLYDMGLLSFVGSLGCFVTQYVIFALAIFLDQRRLFPRWLAYMSLWGVVTEFIAATIWTFRSGPYAWDGLISFYLGTVIFVIWQIALTVCLYKLVKNQPVHELHPAYWEAAR